MITAMTVGGLAQPLVDVAAVLSLQNKPAHAKSLCEAAWLLETIAKMPDVVKYLQDRP